MADEKVKANVISMLDLENDTEDIAGYNPEADANAAIPPFPAGEYSFTATFKTEVPEERYLSGVWGKKEQKVIYTDVILTLYNTPGGEYDGRMCRTMVSTFTGDRSGTNSMQGFLQCCGKAAELLTATSRKALVYLLEETVNEGASGKALFDWEASEQLNEDEREKMKDEGKKPWRILGMTKFPEEKDDKGKPTGKYIPEIDHAGVPCRANNVVKRFLTPVEGQVSGVEAAPQAPAATATPPARPAGPVASPATARPAQGPPVPVGAARPATVRPAVASGRK
jgi:hypothetical protein